MDVAGVPVPALPVWGLRWRLLRLRGRRYEPDDGVDTLDQPQVVAMVRDVANDLGVAEPDSVELVGAGPIHGRVHGGVGQLQLPVPQLQSLAVDEVRVLVARELAIMALPHADLVCRLRDLAIHGWHPTRRSDVAPPSDRLVQTIEHFADAVACRRGGSQLVARALVRADLVDTEFSIWANDLTHEVRAAVRKSILDIHAGWQARLDHDDVARESVLTAPESLEEISAAAHAPEVAAAVGKLRPADVALTLPAQRIPLRPCPPGALEALATQTYYTRYFTDYRDWITFAQLPDDVWHGIVADAALAIDAKIAEILSREPGGPAEAVRVVLAHSAITAPHTLPVPPGTEGAVITVAEHVLTRRGWRRRHPAVLGLLTGPGGRDVDLRALAARATRDGAAIEELAQILDGV